MYPELKYLYSIPVFIAFMLSSCDTDMPASEEMKTGTELSFATYVPSRAETPAFDKFAVYGDAKSMEQNGDNPLVIFNNTQVEYKEGSWRYNIIQYWCDDHEHSFVALSPVSLTGDGSASSYLNSRLSFTYTLPYRDTETDDKLSEYTKNTDILAATHRRRYTSGNTDAVHLRFNHLMSKINITPKLDDDNMLDGSFLMFHKLELSGFKTTSTFSILPAAIQSGNQTDDNVVNITGQNGDGKLTITFNDPKKIFNHQTENVTIFDNENAILMLPQTFTADSQAKIILTYSINNGGQNRLVLPLKDIVWESGKSYTYTFTLSNLGLDIAPPSITGWEEANVGNIDAD